MGPERISYLVTLGTLGIVVITLAVIHDSHTGEALAGLLGFAVAGRPASNGPMSTPTATAATLGLAGIVALTASGCGASLSPSTTSTIVREGLQWTCWGANKLCDALDSERHNEACQFVDSLCN